MLIENINYKNGDSVSYEEYKIIEKESENRIEYIYGKIYFLAETSNEHSFIVDNIRDILKEYFNDKKCRVFTETKALYYFDKKICKEKYVYPDVMVICDKENFREDKDGKYYGKPKLIVEVISESSKNKDNKIKKMLYKDLGVEEYIIIDQYVQEFKVFRLKENVNFASCYYGDEIWKSGSYNGLYIEIEKVFNYEL